MGAVNFYLKKAEDSTGKSLIYLKYKYAGRVLVFTFGQTIEPKNWNKDKQRVKNNRQTTADGKHSLNDLLDNLEKVLLKAHTSELKNGQPEAAVLKQKLIQFINRKDGAEQQSDFYSLVDRFIAGEIKHRGQDKKKGTIGKYATVKKHLQAFEGVERYPLAFENINLDFYYKYVSYLKKKNLGQNTVAKHIQTIKTFMNEALDLGYTTNAQFRNRKFSATWVDGDAVYLNEAELASLFKHDFSGNKKLDQVRDLFVFGCWTGLRFSDYSNVKPQNIITVDGERFIKMNQQKTGDQVVIPCDPVVLQIFEKYKEMPNSLPKAISNQKFNDYIKDACEGAGMAETGRLLTDPDKALWQCISSHTARRSFATNLFLSGYPPIEIMKITGHKTEKNFLKYIKISKLDAAKKLSVHMKKRWNEKLLKVA